MEKITEFSINFNTIQPVFYPGQPVAGYVILNLKETMDMIGLRIKLTGKGKCHWTERGKGDEENTSYTGKETIIKQSACLFGSLPTNEPQNNVHPTGKQTYAFSFDLPPHPQLPSSFEGNNGYIRYTLEAKLDRHLKSDSKVKCPITINDLIDTNDKMHLNGVGGEKRKEVGHFCCKTGVLDMSANIDRSCYCPGEAILINANVTNKTRNDMQSLHAKLIQTVTYHASLDGEKTTDLPPTQKSRKVTKQIARLKGPDILKGECATWGNQPFGVPACPPTITNSKIITIQYKLKVIVVMPWCIDPEIKMHIVVGTIPYLATYGKPVVYGTAQDKQSGPQVNYIDGVVLPPPKPSDFGYPDMPPPSYSAAAGAQCVNIGNENDEYTYGELKYSPIYTFAQPYQETLDEQ